MCVYGFIPRRLTNSETGKVYQLVFDAQRASDDTVALNADIVALAHGIKGLDLPGCDIVEKGLNSRRVELFN